MGSGLLRIVAMAALAASLSTGVWAQYEESDKSRIGLGVAFVRPSDPSLSSVKGTWLGLDLDIHLTYDELGRPDNVLSFAWFGNESGSTKASLFPLKLTFIKRFGDDEHGGLYVGAGPDLYYARYEAYDWDPILRDYVSASDSATKLGFGLVCGLEFRGAWYVEARYDKLGELERSNGGKIELSGWTLTLGTRLAL